MCFILFIGWRVFISINRTSKIRKTYPDLSRKCEINNQVISTFYPEQWRGGKYIQFVTLDNGQKFMIQVNKSLFNEKISFGKLIDSGVTIIKNKDSDTLMLIKGKKKYLFLLSLQ